MSCRLPPRWRRWRPEVCPEPQGIGAAPQKRANAPALLKRRLARAGVSLDTSEWFYFRSPEATGQVLAEAEGWVLWRPDTGEQLAFVPVSPPESAPPGKD